MERGYLTQAAEVLEDFYKEASDLEWQKGGQIADLLKEGRHLAGELRGMMAELAMSGGFGLGARAEPPVAKIESYLAKVRDLMKRGYAASALDLLETVHQALWYWEDTGHPEVQRLLDEARHLAGRLRGETGSGPGMGDYYLGGPMPAHVSKKDMANLLVTAWEGGSNYWVEYADYIPPKGMSLKELKKVAWENAPAEEKEFWKTSEGVPLYSLLPFLPPSVKWKIKFKPNEVVKEDDEVYYLTPENMREAVVKLIPKYSHIFARIKSEDYDAGDADAWLQMAIFDDVIFG